MRIFIIVLFSILSNATFSQRIGGRPVNWPFYTSRYNNVVIGEIIGVNKTNKNDKRLDFSITFIKVDSVIKGNQNLINKTIQVIYVNYDSSDDYEFPMFTNKSKKGIFFLIDYWNNNIIVTDKTVIDYNSSFYVSNSLDDNKKLKLTGNIIATNTFEVNEKRKKKYFQKIFLIPDSTSKSLIPQAKNIVQIFNETKKNKKNSYPIQHNVSIKSFEVKNILESSKFKDLQESTTMGYVFLGQEIGLEIKNELCKNCFTAFDKTFYSKQELINYVAELVNNAEK